MPKPFVPEFVCPHCQKNFHVDMSVGQVTMCDCKESRETWEMKHRMEMERRKRAKRGL